MSCVGRLGMSLLTRQYEYEYYRETKNKPDMEINFTETETPVPSQYAPFFPIHRLAEQFFFFFPLLVLFGRVSGKLQAPVWLPSWIGSASADVMGKIPGPSLS